MYSNLITPPDFVTDEFHTVTIINAPDVEVEKIVDFCRYADMSYNVYLYHDNMLDDSWVQSAIDKSDAIILFDDGLSHRNLFEMTNMYYCGDTSYMCPSIKINSALDYFKK